MTAPRLALLAVVAACQSSGDRPAAGQVTPAQAPERPAAGQVAPGASPTRTGVGPALEVLDASPAVDLPALAPFEAERRDEAWAAATEAEVRAAIGHAQGVESLAVSCKTVQCSLDVGARPERVADATAVVERALGGSARHLVFLGVRDQGGMAVVQMRVVYAR